MNKSGIIFQPCSLADMPDEDTLVLGMTSNNEAIIGQLWYDEQSDVFICSSENGQLIVVKWAHITPVQMPDPVNGSSKAAIDHFGSYFAEAERLSDFFAGWDAAIKFIENQLT